MALTLPVTLVAGVTAAVTYRPGLPSVIDVALTAATKVTGNVSAISGVKVGDLVTAQITGTDGKLTATAIQDPASLH